MRIAFGPTPWIAASFLSNAATSESEVIASASSALLAGRADPGAQHCLAIAWGTGTLTTLDFYSGISGCLRSFRFAIRYASNSTMCSRARAGRSAGG